MSPLRDTRCAHFNGTNETTPSKIRPWDLFHQTSGQIKGKPTNVLRFHPKVSTGCEEHIQLQQQRPQEMISVKAVPTTIKLC